MGSSLPLRLESMMIRVWHISITISAIGTSLSFLYLVDDTRESIPFRLSTVLPRAVMYRLVPASIQIFAIKLDSFTWTHTFSGAVSTNFDLQQIVLRLSSRTPPIRPPHPVGIYKRQVPTIPTAQHLRSFTRMASIWVHLLKGQRLSIMQRFNGRMTTLGLTISTK